MRMYVVADPIEPYPGPPSNPTTGSPAPALWSVCR